MIKINILCVGRIKEKFFSDAVNEYMKRLKRYTNITIIEVPDEKCPENLSEAEERNVIEKEGKALLRHIKEGFVIALDIKGNKISSTELAEFIKNKMTSGTSCFNFIIGGSLGLSQEIRKRADYLLSFSSMTFPHQLMRVILLEQLYRTQKIMRNEPYHK